MQKIHKKIRQLNLFSFSRVIILSILAILVFTNLALATFSESDWSHYRDINNVRPGFTRLVLPMDISKGKRDFSDVRIITNSGIEVPHLITRNATVRNADVSGRILDKTVINGQEQFIIDTGEQGNVHTGVTLNSSLNNFRRQVSIYSSPSLLSLNDSRWNVVTTDGYIYRFTDNYSGYSSGKDSINFNANTARYLKIIIGAGEEGPINVNSTRVYGDRKIDIPTYSENVSAVISNNTEKRATEIVIDLGVTGKLTDAITIYTGDKNYNRRVLVDVSDNISHINSWRPVGQGSISNISTTLFSGYSNRVTYPEQNTRYIRLSIVNDDNRPLNVQNNVLVEGPLMSLIFEARSGESYRLYYGNKSAVRPTYDIGAISNYVETNSLPESILGSEMNNPNFVAPKPPIVPITEKYPWLLNTLLAIVVLIIGAGIGWYLYTYKKKMGGDVDTFTKN